MSPSLDNDCTIQDLAFQVLKLLGEKNFNIRPLPRIMSFMTWSSKTWTHLEIFFKTWQTKFGNLYFFKTWYHKFWNVTCFCNTMSPSLDNDCAIQDLAFQVLNLFGVKNFNIRPLPRITSFMTWSSKTWTHLEIFFKTWQPQLWNLTFFQDLVSHVLNQVRKSFCFKTWYPKFWTVTLFCNTMSPSLDNDCTIQDFAFQVLKLFRVKNFNVRPLPRIMSFMTWSSTTWTHLEIFSKTWQTKFGNLYFFKTWYHKFWNVTCFCNTMSPSLDNDCAIQDLAFQVLKLFGVQTFNIRPLPRIMSFMTWSSKTWTHLEIFFKTWQPQLWNLTLFSRLGIPSFEMFFWQFHVLKSWQWLDYSRLGFATLETFWAKEFEH